MSTSSVDRELGSRSALAGEPGSWPRPGGPWRSGASPPWRKKPLSGAPRPRLAWGRSLSWMIFRASSMLGGVVGLMRPPWLPWLPWWGPSGIPPLEYLE